VGALNEKHAMLVVPVGSLVFLDFVFVNPDFSKERSVISVDRLMLNT
jgi:hypothetical protein